MVHMMQNTHTRPGGISFLATMIIIGGIITVVSAILALLELSVPVIRSTLGNVPSDVAYLDGFAVIAAAQSLLVGWVALGAVGVAQMFVAWGLFSLKTWAYWIVVIVSFANIAGSFVAWWQHSVTTPTFILSAILPVLILLYLLRSAKVREAFGM